MHIAPFAAALLLTLALTLAACSSPSSPEPDTTTIAGDGDGDQGDGDGDEASEPAPDMGEPLLDVPSEGEAACCICGEQPGDGYCEMETFATAQECGDYWGQAEGAVWEWQTNCYEAGGEVVCPGSCVHPDA